MAGRSRLCPDCLEEAMPEVEICGCPESLALRAEVERLRGLLAPFAHFADIITDHASMGNVVYCFVGPRGEAAILKSDCEAAREALALKGA